MAFKKGQSGNPNGRPKGSTTFSLASLLDAMREVEIEKKKSLYKHAVEQAYVDNKVLVALLGKIIPQVPTGDPEGDKFEDEEIGFIGVPTGKQLPDKYKRYLN